MKERKAEDVRRQFNETINQWINWLDDYTLQMLCTKPGNGTWSLGQVYVHIATNTVWFITQVNACLLNNVGEDKDMHADAKIMFANNAFPDVLIEGPPSNLNVPQPNTKEALLQSLITLRDEVDSLCAAFNISTSGKTKHPGLLYFNALQWLQFADMHMRHHYRQKKRIDEVLFNRGND